MEVSNFYRHGKPKNPKDETTGGDDMENKKTGAGATPLHATARARA